MRGCRCATSQPSAGNKFNIYRIIVMWNQGSRAQFHLNDSAHYAVGWRNIEVDYGNVIAIIEGWRRALSGRVDIGRISHTGTPK
jgi:hypothetical protein